MKPPFDIAADLDTPVSAYLKLAPFRPRFLLESVEGGERLARYSFIGFGDCLEVRIAGEGVNIGGVDSPRPKNRQEFLSVLRGALARAPGPLPKIPGVPLLGGLVGYTAYDAVRYFEHLPGRTLDATPAPHAHYVAPRSLLVFDHLTRGVALLHDGTEADRQAARRRAPARGWKILQSAAFLNRGSARGARQTRSGVHCIGRRVPAGSRVAIRRQAEYRAVRGLSRVTLAESLALYVLLRARGYHRGGFLARSAGEVPFGTRAIAAHRGLAATRRR